MLTRSAVATVFPTHKEFCAAVTQQSQLLSWCIAFDAATCSMPATTANSKRGVLHELARSKQLELSMLGADYEVAVGRLPLLFRGYDLPGFSKSFELREKYNMCLGYFERGSNAPVPSVDIQVNVEFWNQPLQVNDPMSLISRVHSSKHGLFTVFPDVPHLDQFAYLSSIQHIRKAVADFKAKTAIKPPEQPGLPPLSFGDIASASKSSGCENLQSFEEGMRAGYDLALSRGVRR